MSHATDFGCKVTGNNISEVSAPQIKWNSLKNKNVRSKIIGNSYFMLWKTCHISKGSPFSTFMMYRSEHWIYFCLADKVKKTGIGMPAIIRMMLYNKTIWRHISTRRQNAEYIKRQTMTLHMWRSAVLRVSYFKGSSQRSPKLVSLKSEYKLYWILVRKKKKKLNVLEDTELM